MIFLAEAFTRRGDDARARASSASRSPTRTSRGRTQRWELAEYVDELAHGRGGASTSGRTSSSTRRTSSPSTSPRAARRRSPPRLILAATLSPTLRHLLGLRALRARASGPGARSTSTPRSTRSSSAALDGPLLPLVAAPERRSAATTRRSSGSTTCSFLETENDALVAYAKREGRNLVITVVNVDPHNAQEGARHRPLRARPAAVLRRRPTCSTASRYDWRVGGNYVRLDPGERAGHVLHVDAP